MHAIGMMSVSLAVLLSKVTFMAENGSGIKTAKRR